MKCDGRELELNALIDGESSREGERSLLAHVATCPACAAELAGLVALRMRLAWLAPVEAPPDALAAKIEGAIAPQHAIQRARLRWPIAGAVATLALAAGLLLLIGRPHAPGSEIRSVADAALRQTIAPAAIVLADTRRGGADAWFARHHLAKPPVPDLSKAGFAFLGCRTDIIAGHRASILVYGQGTARLTLIAWPADGEPAHRPRTGRIDGRSVRYWNNGRLALWATGAPQSEVGRFAAAYRASL